MGEPRSLDALRSESFALPNCAVAGGHERIFGVVRPGVRRLQAIAIGLKAIASRLEAIATRFLKAWHLRGGGTWL